MLLLLLSLLHQRNRRRLVLTIDSIDCCSTVMHLCTDSAHAERTTVLAVLALHVVLPLSERVICCCAGWRVAGGGWQQLLFFCLQCFLCLQSKIITLCTLWRFCRTNGFELHTGIPSAISGMRGAAGRRHPAEAKPPLYTVFCSSAADHLMRIRLDDTSRPGAV